MFRCDDRRIFVFSNEESQPDDAMICACRQEQRVRGKPVLDAALKRSELAPYVHELPTHESLGVDPRRHACRSAGGR